MTHELVILMYSFYKQGKTKRYHIPVDEDFGQERHLPRQTNDKILTTRNTTLPASAMGQVLDISHNHVAKNKVTTMCTSIQQYTYCVNTVKLNK